VKVAIVHNFHAGDVPSGENEVVDAERAALERADIEVHLAAVRNDDLARRPLHTLSGAMTVATGIGISPLKELRGFQPDVVHVHSLFPYLGNRWVDRSPAPVVATMHSYRPVCANGYLFRDGAVCTLCADGHRWSGVRHGCYRDSALATVPLAWAGRRGPTHDRLLRAAAALLVLSERARSVFAAAGIPDARMTRAWHFLPAGMDPGPGDRRDEAWLFVGRLSPEKGIDRLVDAWPAEVPLRIVGDGPLASGLKTASIGKRIELLGRLGRPKVVEQMQRAFGLVFPSRWFETFGLTYMEALAAGLPTLAFPPNVVADSVAEDGTGVVASWDDVPGAVAAAHGSFDALRPRCRAVFNERFTEEAFVERRRRLYDSLAR